MRYYALLTYGMDAKHGLLPYAEKHGLPYVKIYKAVKDSADSE